MKADVNSISSLIKSDGSFDINRITLLASVLISPSNANIIEIKLALGSPLTPDELRQLLNNPNSLLHKIFTELMLLICKYLSTINKAAYQQLQKAFFRTQYQIEIQQELEIEERAHRLKIYLEKIDWAKVPEVFQRITQHTENYIQHLLHQNIIELNYLLRLALDKESRLAILKSMLIRNELMEKHANTIKQLGNFPDTDPEFFERYQRHLELSSLENKLKYNPYYHDPDKIVQIARKDNVIEEMHLVRSKIRLKNLKLNKPDKIASSSSAEILRHFSNKPNDLFNELHKNLADALALFSEKYPQEPLPFWVPLNEFLKDSLLFRKDPSVELKKSIQTEIELIAEMIPLELRYKVFMLSLKKAYQNNVIPFRTNFVHILENFDAKLAKLEKQNLTKDKKQANDQSENQFIAVSEDHTISDSKQQEIYKPNEKDELTFISIISFIKDQLARDNASNNNNNSQNMVLLLNSAEELASGKILLSEVSNSFIKFVEIYNKLVNEYLGDEQLNYLYEKISSLKFVGENDILRPSMAEIECPSVSPGADF